MFTCAGTIIGKVFGVAKTAKAISVKVLPDSGTEGNEP